MEKNDNPLDIQLDDQGIATDMLELRELAHHAARGFLEEVMQNPVLSFLEGFDYLIGFMQYLHDVTCPGDNKHWVDFQARLDEQDEGMQSREAKAQDPISPLNPTFLQQVYDILGKTEHTTGGE